MRLIHTEAGLDIHLDEMVPSIVTLENIERFSEYINELLCQFEGESGGFVLSEREKTLPLSKHSTLVLNPFSISCNEPKILKRVYAELNEEALSVHAELTAEINSYIISYLDQLVGGVHYPLRFELEMDIPGLLKLYGVKLDETDTDLLTRLTDYIKLSHRILGVVLFIFVGIKSYLSNDQLRHLYHEMQNEKAIFLDFESRYIDKIAEESHTLFDKDWCFIQL